MSCLQGGTSWGIGDNVFSCIVTLPNAASDWRFSVNLCCRNWGPIIFSSANGIISVYPYATLNNLNFPSNSSPLFNSNLMPLFCLGVFTVNSFNCIDPDGDSLTYEIDSLFSRSCSSDSASTAEYFSPYSYLNFLDSSTPITMNSFTGELSFTLSTIQLSIYAIKITEYRNGVIVGSFNRQEELKTTLQTTIETFANHYQDKLMVYPNPAYSTLRFNLKRKENIVVYNLFGEILLNKSYSSHPDETGELDISKLSPGVYLIKAGHDVRKFIKE
jgi:hypothetical protein